MLSVGFDKMRGAGLRLLCLGAHSDDIEIGCGGSILKLLSANEDTDVLWIVFSAIGERAREATTTAEWFLSGAKRKSVVIENFRDSVFPYIGGEIKAYFEDLKQRFSPDLVFTHYRFDLHQDHRLIAELTWNTFRDHLIFEYEVLKYDGDLGSPNLFFHLDTATARRKVEYILKGFESQRDRRWFTADAFASMMRIRGIESNAPENFAEGFFCRKIVL